MRVPPIFNSTELIKAWPSLETHAHCLLSSPESAVGRATRRYTLLTRSPLRWRVTVTLRPKSAAPETAYLIAFTISQTVP